MSNLIDTMFEKGAHFGYSKTRRHPSASKFIYGTKNRVDIIDLTQTEVQLENAKTFLKDLGSKGKQILWVGVKPEAKKAVLDAATDTSTLSVTERWVGGVLTNFSEIKKRIARLIQLKADRDSGELEKYTKKERLLIDREIADMETNFSGLITMTAMPFAVIVVDAKREHIAVTECQKMNIPVIALMNTDCDNRVATFPIVANDGSVSSITFFIDELKKAYKNQ